MVKLRHPDRLGLHIRIVLPDGVVIGPGRADLLEAIRVHGSISAAGRALGMSYKRAWDLVSAMNNAFREPMVRASAGGEAGGGAVLTETGEAVLDAYRRLETVAAKSAAGEVAILESLLPE